jgi:hypothetical protein
MNPDAGVPGLTHVGVCAGEGCVVAASPGAIGRYDFVDGGTVIGPTGTFDGGPTAMVVDSYGAWVGTHESPPLTRCDLNNNTGCQPRNLFTGTSVEAAAIVNGSGGQQIVVAAGTDAGPSLASAPTAGGAWQFSPLPLDQASVLWGDRAERVWVAGTKNGRQVLGSAVAVDGGVGFEEEGGVPFPVVAITGVPGHAEFLWAATAKTLYYQKRDAGP